MIKFFRHIRKSLLMENNTGKYLKYAIGEIFLVVIGIIIALQLNNWNEEQKKLKLKETYRKALLLDYSNDTLELKQLIQLKKTELDSLNALRKFIHSNSATPDDFRKLFENFVTTNMIDYEYNTNTYEVIIATGNIDLFDTQSIQMIMELKKSQNKAIRGFGAMSDVYQNQLVQITQNFPVFSNYSMGIEAKKLIWQTVDLEKLPMITDGITGLKRYNLEGFIIFNEYILLKTEKLIEHLENLEK